MTQLGPFPGMEKHHDLPLLRRGRLPGRRFQQRVWPGRERTLSNALHGQARARGIGTGEPDRPRWVNYRGDEAADT
jgi:hypothetical protein